MVLLVFRSELVSEVKEVKLPGGGYSDLIRARFWLVSSGRGGYLGIGRISLLEYIEEFGSINRAAKEMGMSYKKSWKLVEDMNLLHKAPLVISEKGGKDGGGTRLTELGKFYVAEFRALEKRCAEFLQAESADLEAKLAGLLGD